MSTHRLLILAAALCLAPAGLGCEKSSSANSSKEGDKKSNDKKADDKAAEKSGAMKIDKLGLQIEVPGEAIVSDGMSDKDIVLSGPEVGGLSIGVASDSAPKTLKEAQSDADAFNPRNVKGESLSDGWALTFENTGSMGVNYWVQSRREIGGRPITCDTAADTAAKATAALAACKSLKKT